MDTTLTPSHGTRPGSSRFASPIRIAFALGAVAIPVGASSWNFQAGGSKDNEGLMDLRSSATWNGEATPIGYPALRVGFHRSAAGELAGLAGGTRDDLSLQGTLINGLGRTRLTSVLGMDALQDPSSWRARLQADWMTGVLGGMRATGSLGSGWMEGWLARDVRANTVKLAVGWDGPRNWIEAGLQLEDRSGGRQPGGSIPVSLERDLVTTAWVWGTRSWTPWLQMGLSANAANSTVETHQAVNTRNDTLLWVDVPYGSPHEEAAISGLARLSWRGAHLGTSWPVWSTSRRRVDGVSTWDQAYWYTLRNASMAQIDAGGELVVLQRAVLGLEAKALSLPYRPYAWFTRDAWNQVSLNLTVRFASPF